MENRGKEIFLFPILHLLLIFIVPQQLLRGGLLYH